MQGLPTRDMCGYGAHPPIAHWDHNALIAINFVVNYEEGGERCLLHGDSSSEAFLSDMIGTAALPGTRNMQIESLYEYGSRAGFWRLHRLFTRHQMPVTVFGVTTALEKNAEAVAAMGAAGWEVATHGYRWLDYQNVPEAMEALDLERAVQGHTLLTGARPRGCYIGRTSPHSARLCARAGFLYDADSYADDLPYYTQPLRQPAGDSRYQLVVPYTLDVNDMKFAALNGFTESEQFFQYLKDQFDVLYAEGEAGAPKMMSVGLHARLSGKPARMAGLQRFLQYIETKRDTVWVATREAIARNWLKHHPPPGKTFFDAVEAEGEKEAKKE